MRTLFLSFLLSFTVSAALGQAAINGVPNQTVTGVGGTFNAASPGNIGATTPAQGNFTDVIPSNTPCIDVRSKGALVGDATSDTAGFAAAINAASASGDTVCITEGNWFLNNSLTFNALPPHLKIWASPNAVIKASPTYTLGSKNSLLYFTNTSDIEISGGIWDGSARAEGAVLIESSSMSTPITHIHLHDMQATATTGLNFISAIEVQAPNAGLTSGDPAITDVLVKHVHTYLTTGGGIAISQTRNASIVDSTVDTPCGYPAQSSGAATSGGCAGIDVTRSADVTLLNSHVNKMPFITNSGTNPSPAIYAAFSSNVNTTNTSVAQGQVVNTPTAMGANVGIYYDMDMGGTIPASSVSDGGGGIRVEVSKDISINGGTFTDNSASGIVINTRADSAQINSFDAVTNVTPGTNVTASTDTVDFKEGTGSYVATASAAITSSPLVTLDTTALASSFTYHPIFLLWIKSSVAVQPNTLSLLAFYSGTQVSTIPIPALEAGAWVRLELYDRQFGVQRWTSGITSLVLTGSMQSGQTIKLDDGTVSVPFDDNSVSNVTINRPGFDGIMFAGGLQNSKAKGNTIRDPGYSAQVSLNQPTNLPYGINLVTSYATDNMGFIDLEGNTVTMSPGLNSGVNAGGIRICAVAGAGSSIHDISVTNNPYSTMAAPFKNCGGANITNVNVTDIGVVPSPTEVITYFGTLNLSATTQASSLPFIPIAGLTLKRLEWQLPTNAVGCATPPIMTVYIGGVASSLTVTIPNNPYSGYSTTGTATVPAGSAVSVHTTQAYATCTQVPGIATLMMHYSMQ